eukprot:scaffold754_cov248-Pinguiococcus_pyrenoidosus.AAC.52
MKRPFGQSNRNAELDLHDLERFGAHLSSLSHSTAAARSDALHPLRAPLPHASAPLRRRLRALSAASAAAARETPPGQRLS